jgi:hypothetical protein
MKAYGLLDVQIHVVLTSALYGGEWSTPRSGRFTLREGARRINWIGGCVDSRDGAEEVGKREILELS